VREDRSTVNPLTVSVVRFLRGKDGERI